MSNMSIGTTGRPLLPQAAQMQTFSFAPPNLGPRENQKSYVFVDEHNRHKRLKVMRACEGCRRRKIKCDAATTNTWPCSACIRLKLHCVPPTLNGERDFSNGDQNDTENYEQNDRPEFSTSNNGATSGDYEQRASVEQQFVGDDATNQSFDIPATYADGMGMYRSAPFQPPVSTQSDAFGYQFAATMPEGQFRNELFPTPPTQAPSDTAESWHSEHSSAELSETLGELKIDDAGVAPYISHKRGNLAETHPQENIDTHSVPYTIGPDLTVRIPPEYMPSEAQALKYFEIFFNNIHPYVPVLNKAVFYDDWFNSRESISPLLLEAVFACAGMLSKNKSQGQTWLSLVGKHSDAFMDVPRLSTIQAMLLVMKARESVPKPGYYYRSWMTVVTLVAMAKDLGLDEHYAQHERGIACGSIPSECLAKTRVWLTLFVVELMIGAPQGRTDMSVNPDSIDLRSPALAVGIDQSEQRISRDFNFFAKIVLNVRTMNDTMAALKKKKVKDWGADPDFVRLNPMIMEWLYHLPRDLQVPYPPDNSPPKISSHMVGNMHSYYYLSILLLHRPQLALENSFAPGGEWKQHMILCYNAAKNLCRMQEAILNTFGLTGLLCMQRGINFTIYCILTCTVLHLAAITSPYPEFNNDARDYFSRHMRILERCTSSWPMPEIQDQIDALREAFSADTSKPFELKSSFPLNSPLPQTTSTPNPMDFATHSITPLSSIPMDPTSHFVYTTQPLTPPISADSQNGSPANLDALTMMSANEAPQQHPHYSQHHHVTSAPSFDASAWNPTRIFDQWHTAFGQTPALQSPPPTNITSNPLPIPRSHSNPLQQSPFDSSLSTSLPQQPQTLQQHHTPPPIQPQYHPSSQSPPTSQLGSGSNASQPILPTFVSPSMWQDSVASVYGAGMKRRRDFGNQPGSAVLEGMGIGDDDGRGKRAR